jgi:epoxyqueuosine reductase QueG
MRESDDSTLTREVEERARAGGAQLVGFADLQGIADLPRAVAIAIAHSLAVLRDADDMPNRAYSGEYFEVNRRLTEAAQGIAEMLGEAGFEARANPSTTEKIDPRRLAAPFPHKTAATRAGLGWVGKTALLVTEQYGPAIRLVSVLTDAPLLVGEPIAESRCGECVACVEACPAGAATGEHWHAGRPREEIFDAHACHRMCGQRSRAAGIEAGICGVCMAVCPRRPRA